MMFVGFMRAYLNGEPRLVSDGEAVRYRHMLNQRVLSVWPRVLNWLVPRRKTVGWS